MNLPFFRFLILGFLTLSSWKTNAQSQLKKTIQKGTHSFELTYLPPDTIFAENVETGELVKKISVEDWKPTKMDGKSLKVASELGNNYALTEKSLDIYFMEYINENRGQFSQLPNVQYSIGFHNIVVDEKGNIVYYTFSGIETKYLVANHELKKELEKQLCNFIESGKIKFQPAVFEGKKIPSAGYNSYVKFSIQNNQLQFDI